MQAKRPASPCLIVYPLKSYGTEESLPDAAQGPVGHARNRDTGLSRRGYTEFISETCKKMELFVLLIRLPSMLCKTPPRRPSANPRAVFVPNLAPQMVSAPQL